MNLDINNDPIKSIQDIFESLCEKMNVNEIESNPTYYRKLIAELATKMQQYFKIASDFTALDINLKRNQEIILKYANKWNHISDIKNNAKEFMKDTKFIVSNFIIVKG